MRITWENLDTEEYSATPGIEYEVADGCVRKLKRPFIDVMDAFLDRLNNAGNGVSDWKQEDEARIACLEICTDGDPLPENLVGVDLVIVNRAVADFFTFRIPRPARQPKS